MVRSTHCLRVIEEEKLIENAETMGRVFLHKLKQLAAEEPVISGVRGRGLIIAFDLPDAQTRERFYKGLFETGLLAIRSGEKSIRFRQALDVTAETIEAAMGLLREQCRRLRAPLKKAA
jgi:L-lysine 6-transaminase